MMAQNINNNLGTGGNVEHPGKENEEKVVTIINKDP